ncbi:MAG TPA: DNA-binding domain-containing protein [Usitatibacter sp.]|nr:DNA-binding domain-containing protein [Usitatibacter sp.]
MSRALAPLQRDFLAGVEGDGPCAPGLEVYRRGVLENRIGALGAAYPVVRRLVGESFFREAAARYARAHPSISGDLNEFGDRMAAFLAAYPHAAALPYLADVARLEWAVHESLRAEDGVPVDFAGLAGRDPDHYAALRFALAPSVRCIASLHAIHALWCANQPGRDGTACHDVPERVLVWRRAGAVEMRVLDAGEWEFLDAVARGETLGACHEHFGDDLRFAGMLARHALDGVLGAVAE